MNIDITSIFLNKNKDIEFSYSVNDRNEQDETMNKYDFAKLLCEHSDGDYRFIEDDFENEVHALRQTDVDRFDWFEMSIKKFNDTEIDTEIDYCKDCLNKYIQSLNKNL